jgi:hypothetical protein
MQRIHRKDDYKFDCDMCDFKTYMKTKLDDHVKLRDKQSANMFFCEKCDFKSCTSYGLVFHRSKIHQITKLMKRYAFKKHFNQNYKNECIKFGRSHEFFIVLTQVFNLIFFLIFGLAFQYSRARTYKGGGEL